MAIIKWKTIQEIEDEKNKLKEPSEFEKIRIEQAQANIEIVDLLVSTSGGIE